MSCDCDQPGDCSCNQGCGDGGCWPPPSSAIPGPQGPAGPTGSAGTNGVNAFTVTIDPFTVPAVNANVNVAVNSRTAWVALGQDLFVESAGYYSAAAIIDTGNITLTNLGSPGNATPGTVIAMNSKISPAGPAGVLTSPLPINQGGTGQATQIAAFGALSPLTTAGDSLTYSSGANARIAIGAANTIWTSNGTLPGWATNAPAAANITGTVAIANGGTGASTASGARTNLDIAGLAETNVLSGSNTFVITGNGFFEATVGSSAILMKAIGGNLSDFYLYNAVNGNLIDIKNSQIKGIWSYTGRAFVNANTSTYTFVALAPDTVVSTYSATGTQVITLPSTATGKVNGSTIKITDGSGNAGTNAITLARSDSDTILGATAFQITNNYGSISLIYVAATSNWVYLP